MSRSDHSADVSADVALDGDSATVHIVETRTLDLDDLFRDVHDDGAPADARLRLWSDAAGWNGYELRDGDYYRVNYSDLADGYVDERRVTIDDVERAVRDHIEDEDAGLPGRFVRGATPP